MALDLTSLANLGFPEILLWLLTFAIVYGILSHAGDKGIPKSPAARAIIGLVAAFFVLFAVPTSLIGVLSQMSSSLVLVLLGFLVFVVFIEAAGLKGKYTVVTGVDPKTGQPSGYKEVEMNIIQKYPVLFGVAFLILAVLIFIGSGGAKLLGFPTVNISDTAIMSYIFLGVIVLAIVWMVADPSKKQ